MLLNEKHSEWTRLVCIFSCTVVQYRETVVAAAAAAAVHVLYCVFTAVESALFKVNTRRHRMQLGGRGGRGCLRLESNDAEWKEPAVL